MIFTKNSKRYENADTSEALGEAAAATRHALQELDVAKGRGLLDYDQLKGIRSELLDAALLLTGVIDDSENAISEAVEALHDTANYGPGYPV